MISIIMSIGFAVDLSAHIVYAFVAAHGDNTKKRLFEALEHIGWPIFQVTIIIIAYNKWEVNVNFITYLM